MEKNLVIVGTGSHARRVYYSAVTSGWTIAGFTDENPNPVMPVDGEVFLPYDEIVRGAVKAHVFVAIGNCQARARIQKELMHSGMDVATIIHPSATVSPDSAIGRGAIIMAGAVVESLSIIGDGVIADIGCLVDHNAVIGMYSHLKPGCIIGCYSEVAGFSVIDIGEIIRKSQ